MTEKATNISERLAQLLEKERTALLAGDLEKISDLIPEKEDLIATMGRSGEITQTMGAELTLKLRRNHALFESSLSGIRAVAARIANHRKMQSTLQIYNAQGEKKVVQSQDSSTVQKLA